MAEPRTAAGRAGRALIYLRDATVSPELLASNAFLRLFEGSDGAKADNLVAQRVARDGDLARCVLHPNVRPHCSNAWIKAAEALNNGQPRLFDVA
ncbi:hypothetical protein [Deinococcus soli (ex Cha et al. 2016)]|uniref:Uncharacterized protein n=2 Tax=Deinococcus soli (ex Cha et al. 2016) TaxID=1309411 RepID=A0AAE3XCP3_9DEIO|nr:hypothetical protein [Deinococcus soli (ex Cha et al. 2016)]MDR6218468.1 hypothetical protein [Deinococcus soli (ex Cha et al. 2016)]MDR6329208.1 hypothetical protein [Deinococcus soli (ex Cha et al. 2016)]MDR6751481.1 hypothetical protein [Deinococcus soli (ex Cha et al. 2016)]